MLTNWCGDDGFISKIGWRFVNDLPAELQAETFPADFYRPSVLLKVPRLKGRFLNTHGVSPDAFKVYGYVYDKFEKDGEYFVELACWCEDFDGNIAQECPATVKLPSRNAK
jgi:hypothetical protein